MGKVHHTAERFDETKGVRVDKWVWAVRILKSRTEATHYADQGWITVNGNITKASKKVKIGDKVVVRKKGFAFEFEVLGVLEKRMGPDMANECKKWLNEAEFVKAKEDRRMNAVIQTVKGEARENLTKKDKRKMQKIKELWD